MKQNDVAMLILIVGVCLMIFFPLGNVFLAGDSSRTAEVEEVEPIGADFPEVDEDIFDEEAVNLVRTIFIGETTSPSPFVNSD